MNRMLLIGDPHFRIDNVDETAIFSTHLHNFLTNHPEIDMIVVLGDILHNHEKLHTSALNVAVDFFKMLISFNRNLYCLVGNHDATSNQIFLTDNHWLKVLKEWPGITIVDKPLKVNLQDGCAVLCPYVPDGRLVEALNTLDDWKNAKYICAHQLIDGAKMGPIVAQGVEEWKEEYPFLFLGHLHDKQRIGKNAYAVGSSLQHSYGEGSDKSLALIDLSKQIGFDNIEEIYLEIKRKKIMYANVNELEELSNKIKDLEDNNIEYKIVLSGEESDFKAIKNSSLYKETKLLENVKDVVFKHKLNKKIENETSEISSNENEDDFIKCLEELIQKENDPFLTSLYEHVLMGKDDISDKDVLFF